jgi:SAM-dependent methyltransferase
VIPAFANPLLLWGLAAAAVPVIIHLLNRRRYRTQRWAAMEWLLAAVRKNQKRLRMENLLLLLLRTCAVLFLALALARPTFSATSLSLDRQASHLYLLLDNSASTGARTGAGTVFEMESAAASSLLNEVGNEDPVTLVLTNDDSTAETATNRKTGRPRVVLRGTHDHTKVRERIGELKPANARADLVEALKVLEEAVPQHPTVATKVAILTDLQRATFEDADSRGGAAPDAALRATLQRLKEKGAEVVLMPFGRAVGNVAITALRVQDDRDIVQGATAVFEAEIRNFGDHDVSAEVRFLVDGKERGNVSQPAQLRGRPAGSDAPPAVSVQYTTTFRDDEIGVHTIEARIGADPLPVDDARTLAFEVRKPINVLAVDGDPNPKPGATSETYLLKPALAMKDGGPITVRTESETDFEGRTDFASFDLIVLANVEHPARSEAQKQRLDRFVRAGGALLLTVGDRVAPDVWNRELFGESNPLLPARLDEPRVDPTKAAAFRFDLSENRHPMLADVTNPKAASFFRSPLVWGRMQLKDGGKQDGARIVMSYDDLAKSPALIERAVGRGRVLLLTTTVDEAWGKLAGDYIFPVLLHEAVYYLTSHGNAERNLFAYQVWSRPVPDHFAAIEVTLPDGSLGQVNAPDELNPFATFTDTNQLGAYRTVVTLKPADILAPAPPPVRDAFAVNLPPAESDLARLSPEDVASRWPGLLRVATSFAAAADAARPKGGEFHAPLIVAAILCLLGEVLLVRRIARTRTSAA